MRNQQLFAKKQDELRARVTANPDWNARHDAAWAAIEVAEGTRVRYIEERQKADAERLDGYHDAQLPALELRLF